VRRHPAWTSIIAIVVVFLVIGAAESAAGKNGSKQPAAGTTVSTVAARVSASATPSQQASPEASRSPAAAQVSKPKISTKATTNPKAKSKAATIKAEATACGDRPNASGDIYLWILSPGTPAIAQELGGEWGWNYATNQCLTSVQLMLAAAPTGPGTCTQVGYVKDNPSYDADAEPAKRLKVLAGEIGPAC